MINGVKLTKPRTKVGRANRPHHRTTIVTTTKKCFDTIGSLKEGDSIVVECPNDIVSSAKGGSSKIHHSLRRVTLLRRQMSGGFRRVRVRWEQGNEIACALTGTIFGSEDENTFRVEIKR